MRVDGYSQVHPAQGIRPPHHLPADRIAPEPAQRAAGPVDQLEISPAALEAARAADAADVRHELVAKIRQQIAEGTYETPQKLDRALTRLLDELG